MHNGSSSYYGNPAGTAPSFTVPVPVAGVLARLPAYPGSLLLVTALNLALARHLPADVGQIGRAHV